MAKKKAKKKTVAKKKVTKKAKKKAKKGKKKARKALDPLGNLAAVPLDNLYRPYNGLTDREADMALQCKVLRISQRCPEIQATGEFVSERQGESFKFTIYHDVMKVLYSELQKERLTWIGYADKDHQTTIFAEGRHHYAVTHYRLADADTGYYIIVPAFGMGDNRFWALDSARTLGCKHAILETLHISWDNRSATEALIARSDSLVADVVGECMKRMAEKFNPLTDTQAVQEMKDCYGKGKPNAKESSKH